MNKKIILLLGFILITLTISIIVYIINKPTHVEYMGDTSIYDLEKFREGLKQIKLKSEIFSNLDDIYNLLGKNKSEINQLFHDIKVMKSEFGIRENNELIIKPIEYNIIDNCALVLYDNNDIVSQVSTGSYGTKDCFDNAKFTKETRLNLLGKEDFEDRFIGLPGYGEYFYLSKGLSLIKKDISLAQVWITNVMTMEDYKKRFGYKGLEGMKEFRINKLVFNHPETDDQDKVLPATPEI